jgi:Fic family protein
LLKWYKNNSKLHSLVLASAFHHKFEKIHPFSDGNGRTGRMIMNYILMRNNYPPMIVRKKTRSEYLDSLSKADNSGLNEIKPVDYKKLINYLGNELVTSYWNNFLV